MPSQCVNARLLDTNVRSMEELSQQVQHGLVMAEIIGSAPARMGRRSSPGQYSAPSAASD